jgi:hypothetical protein
MSDICAAFLSGQLSKKSNKKTEVANNSQWTLPGICWSKSNAGTVGNILSVTHNFQVNNFCISQIKVATLSIHVGFAMFMDIQFFIEGK